MNCPDLQALLLQNILDEQPEAIERHLNDCVLCKPHAASLRRQTSQLRALPADDFFAGVDRKLRPAVVTSRTVYPLLVAAVLLMVVGGISMQWLSNRAATTPAQTHYPAQDSILFIDAIPDDQSVLVAVLQEMNQFKVVRCKAGDSVGSTKVLSVDENGVELLRDGSPARHYTRRELRAEFDTHVAAELSMLNARISDATFHDTDFFRLRGFADMGRPDAVALLRQVAASTLPQAAEARNILADTKEIDNVEALVQRALQRDHPYRLRMIESLGNTASPMTLDALARIAGSPLEDPAARETAVRSLGHTRSLGAAEILQALIDGGSLSDELLSLANSTRETLLTQWTAPASR